MQPPSRAELTLVLVLFSLSQQAARGQGRGVVCTRTNSGPRPDADCAFPFRFDGFTFHSCTTHADERNLPWCSVHTDSSDNHIKGEWGYCHESCPTDLFPAKAKSSILSKEARPGNDDDAVIFDLPQNSQRITTTRRPRPRPTERRTTTTTTRRPRPPPRRTTTTTRRPRTTTTTTRRPSGSTSVRDSKDGRWIPDPSNEECGYDTQVGFVIGGETAVRGQFPFSALLGYTGFGDGQEYFLCGGSLINRRYVLTAAHCHRAHIASGLIRSVVLGEYDVATDPDCRTCPPVERFLISPEDVTVHEDYSYEKQTAGNDIALVRLPRLATTLRESISSIVMPVCLPWMSPNGFVSDNQVYVAGWGKTSEERGQDDTAKCRVKSCTMQKLSLKLRDESVCEQSYQRKLYPDYICAGGEFGKDSCNGDSGGPLIARSDRGSPSYLIGVVAFGTTICARGHPAAYTNVDNYRHWIERNLGP